MAGALSSAAKILGARKKFEESKHRRGPGGKFADTFTGKPQPKAQAGGQSKAGSAKSTVYGIAEKMQGASKKQVVDAAVAAGVHPSTASNHYFYWQKAQAQKAVAKKLGPDPVKTLEKSPDPMGELKKVVGTSIGLRAPKSKAPEATPVPEPKKTPAPEATPVPEPADKGPKLTPKAQKELDGLQALKDKHQKALDSATPGTDLHKKSANNVKYYSSKIKSHKANPDNHVGVEKPADAPVETKKDPDVSKSAFVPKDSGTIHESLKGSHAGAVHNLKLSEAKLSQQEPGSDLANHYKNLVDVNKKKIKDLEAASDVIKSTGFSPMAKGDVHPAVQGNHGVAASSFNYYKKQLEKPNLSAADKKHYKKNMDIFEGKVKELEAKSEQLKASAALAQEKKLGVHPQLQGQYDHYVGLKAALDAKDTSLMSSYQKGNHDIQKAQVEDQLKAIEKHSGMVVTKPVDKMTDKELKTAVDVLPAAPISGQHSFESWKGVNGAHYTDGRVGVAYMKPVRDKAGVTYNNTSPAVKSYTSDGYQNINDGLRDKDDLTAGSNKSIAELDKLIAASTFKEDTIMWRGVGSGGTVFNGAPPPAELTDGGFSSVSFSSSVARGFSDRKTLFRVKVPKGFPGLNIAIGSPPTSDDGLASEAEVLLPRGTTYRVVARHAGAGPKGVAGKGPGGTTINMDVVDLEPVLPPGYPDYGKLG